jgi:asparagine synthase (glutamine-hydrolysing)
MIDVGLRSAPYLCIRKTPEGFESRGMPVARLGDRLHVPGRHNPDGIFAEWSWDGARLLARNDRYGFQPLYYFARDGEIGLSPSLPRLVLEGAPTEIDEAALAVFIRTGFFIGEDTPFRTIRALPPDATLAWSGAGLRISGGLTLARPQRLRRSEAVDGYITLFREAVRRRIPTADDFAVPLSGGRDSRHILLELCESGNRPRFCLTVRHHPPRTDDDAEIAAELTSALGIEHVVLDQTQPRLNAELRKNLETNFCTDEGTAFMPMGDYLAGKARAVFDGIGGDVLSGDLFNHASRLACFESGRLTELAGDVLWAEARAVALLSGDQRRRFGRDLAMSRVISELEKHAEAASPVVSFIFWNRARRSTALFPSCFYGANIEKLCPYIDHALFEFLMSLPARLLLDGTLHTEVITRAYNEYAHVRFDSKERFYDHGERYKAYLQQLTGDIHNYLDEEPVGIVSRSYVRERLSRHLRAGREPLNFSIQLIYLLQLERFAAAGQGR